VYGDSEVPVVGGRQSKSTDGRIDLLALYGEDTIGVVELKLGDLAQVHLSQLEDYLARTDQLSEIAQAETGRDDPNFVGILVGNSIEPALANQIREGYGDPGAATRNACGSRLEHTDARPRSVGSAAEATPAVECAPGGA
jgi:hypothetical protein